MRIRAVGLLFTGMFCLTTLSEAEDLTSTTSSARQAFNPGNYVEAERDNRQALAAAEGSGDPARLGKTLGYLCGVLLATGKYEESQQLCLRAEAILRHSATKEHLPVVLNNLGALASEHGDYIKAESYLKESLGLVQELNPRDAYAARVLNNLGTLYYKMQNYGQAETNLKKAIAIIEREFGREHLWLPPVLVNLGGTYILRRKWDSAEALFERALKLLRNSESPNELELAAVHQNFGVVHYERGHLENAEESFRQAYLLRVRAAPDRPVAALSAASLAITLTKLGRYDEAERLYLDAEHIYEKTRGPRSSEMASIFEEFSKLLRRTEREEAADAMEAKARSIRFELDNTARVGGVRQ